MASQFSNESHEKMQYIESTMNSVDKDLAKANVERYFEIERKIKEVRKETKILRDMKKKLEEEIILFMTKYDIPQIQVNSGDKLKLRETVSKKSTTDKWLDEKFQSFSEQVSDDSTKILLETLRKELDERETTNRKALKLLK